LKIALNSGKMLLHMINDILDYSQASNGTLSLKNQLFSIKKLLKNIADLVEFQAKHKGLDFKVTNNLGNKALVFCDPLRIQQILLNLLGNAIKFTPIGSITLTVKAIDNNPEVLPVLLDGYNLVEFSVRDTGIGIREEDLKKLFKLFGKLDMKENQNMNRTGVGLGLAISQNLAQRLLPTPLGGIKVESKYGEGSKFYFRVPLVDEIDISADLNERSYYEEVVTSSKNSSRKSSYERALIKKSIDLMKSRELKILIVDDDPINQMVGRGYCDLAKVACELANNGKEALELIEVWARKKIYFDLIFMDCNMPVMNGFDASVEVKRMIRNGLIPDVKIIACTANVEHDDRELCFESGMEIFLTKPLRKLEFLDIINKARLH
jgi:CheY-like chemotaxis protein